MLQRNCPKSARKRESSHHGDKINVLLRKSNIRVDSEAQAELWPAVKQNTSSVTEAIMRTHHEQIVWMSIMWGLIWTA